MNAPNYTLNFQRRPGTQGALAEAHAVIWQSVCDFLEFYGKADDIWHD